MSQSYHLVLKVSRYDPDTKKSWVQEYQVEAGKILRKHLNPFVQYFELGEQIVESAPTEIKEEIDPELQRKLMISIHEMEFTVRASNCLEAAKIEIIGDLVRMTEAELLKIRSFGKTSLREIKRKLQDMNLSLGMKIPGDDEAENLPEMIE